MSSKTEQLKALFEDETLHLTPCCWDALSAKLIGQAGFSLTFMSGFGVSASRLGMPDTGLISFGEMVDQARNIAGAVSIPVIGDGDTGFGNAMNVKRTVKAYADAGMAYPLTGLMAAIATINGTLDELKAGRLPEPPMGFEALQRLVGFEEYFEAERRYL